MATLLKSDGTETTVTPKNGVCFELEELQGFVAGYIEIVEISDGRQMVLNEEGKIKQLPFNYKATVLYGTGRDKYEFDPIAGNVLLATFSELEPEDEDDPDGP